MKPIAYAVATLLALTLTACGADPDPSPGPTSPPTVASTSPSAEPTAPMQPDLSYQRTKAGAVAFAKYYWQIVDYAQRTGDTEQLRTLEHGCAACAAGREWIEKIYRRGGNITGGSHTYRRVSVVYADSKTAGLVLRLLTTRQVVSGAGNLSGRYKGGAISVSMAINAVGALWRVKDWKDLS